MIIAICYKEEIRLFDIKVADLHDALIQAVDRVINRGLSRDIVDDLELLNAEEVVDYCLDYSIYITGDIES